VERLLSPFPAPGTFQTRSFEVCIVKLLYVLADLTLTPSIILVSPSNRILLIHRVRTSSAFPSAHVFPGGNVSAADGYIPASGIDRHRDNVAYRTGAIRELFEEAGILLARRSRALARASDCDAVRARVERRETFAGALSGSGLEPAFDRLVLMARWVTPSVLSRRYDARFYLARMPSIQKIVPQEGEVTGWLWATPDRALHDPDITLVYATRSVLETIATGESATELFKRARSQREVPIVAPRMVETESGWVVER